MLSSPFAIQGNMLWQSSMFAIFWEVWLERNRRNFRNIEISGDSFSEGLRFNASLWVSFVNFFVIMLLAPFY